MTIKVKRLIDLEGKSGLAATMEEEIEFLTMTDAFDAIAQDVADYFQPCHSGAIRRVEYSFETVP